MQTRCEVHRLTCGMKTTLFLKSCMRLRAHRVSRNYSVPSKRTGWQFYDEEQLSRNMPIARKLFQEMHERGAKFYFDLASTRTAVRSLGLSGTLAYGFLNTFYYTVGIIITWVFISKVPSGLSLKEFVQYFTQVATYVWVASQLTKSLRIFGACALARPVELLLLYTASTFKTQYKTVFVGYILGCFISFCACILCLASVSLVG